MLGIMKESLHKNTRLVFRKKGKNLNGKLSGKLLEYLESKYQLLPRDMLSLRTVYSKGSLGNLRAYFIRVYDQETASRNGIYIRTYNDLDRRPSLILYSGYILENDFVFITKCDINVVSPASQDMINRRCNCVRCSVISSSPDMSEYIAAPQFYYAWVVTITALKFPLNFQVLTQSIIIIYLTLKVLDKHHILWLNDSLPLYMGNQEG